MSLKRKNSLELNEIPYKRNKSNNPKVLLLICIIDQHEGYIDKYAMNKNDCPKELYDAINFATIHLSSVNICNSFELKNEKSGDQEIYFQMILQTFFTFKNTFTENEYLIYNKMANKPFLADEYVNLANKTFQEYDFIEMIGPYDSFESFTVYKFD